MLETFMRLPGEVLALVGIITLFIAAHGRHALFTFLAAAMLVLFLLSDFEPQNSAPQNFPLANPINTK